jgi:ABC-2 type transport system permease protein
MKNAFAWSVRREVWEHKSVWMAPLAVAALVFLAWFLGVTHLTGNYSGAFSTMPPAQQRTIVATPFSMTAAVILLTGVIVGFFYCLDALHGERRDRSILFWKSMPVSDGVTVAAKASLPLLVIPLIACLIAIATQLLMLMSASAVRAANGIDPATAWNAWPMARQTVVMLYGTGIHALWFAPIYAWLLYVSGWARRAPLLWAMVPVIGLAILERIALGTSWVTSAISYRVLGAMREGFTKDALRQPITELSQLDPGRFFSNPHLWIGFAIAIAFTVLAVRMRRYREPN